MVQLFLGGPPQPFRQGPAATSGLPPGFVLNSVGEIVPASPTNPGARPLSDDPIPANQPVLIENPQQSAR